VDVAPLGRKQSSLVEVAVEIIRDRILDLTLEPGRQISEKMLMEEYGLSRTPSREALNRLAAEGLVDIHSNVGAFVHSLEVSEINQLFEAYHVVERLIGHFCDFSHPGLVEDVRRAQENQREAIRNRDYINISYWHYRHRLRIAETGANTYVYDFCKRIHHQVRRLACFIYRTESADPSFPERQVARQAELHDELLEAIRAADRDRLLAALAHHADIFEARAAAAMTKRRHPAFTLS